MHLKIHVFDAGSHPAADPGNLAFKMRELVPLHAPGSRHRFSPSELKRYLRPNAGTVFTATDTDTGLYVGASVFGQHEGRARLVTTGVADYHDSDIVVAELTGVICHHFAKKKMAVSFVAPRAGDFRQLELQLI